VIKINQRIKQLVGSSTLAITARAKELKAQGKDVVNFAGGEPDFDTPEYIKEGAIQALKDGFTKYTPSTGMPQLKEAIAAKLKRENNLNYQPSQVAVSCGAKHALYNVVQVLADEGDEVLIPAPYWVSYPEMVKLSGARSKIIQTSAANQFKVTPEELTKSISKNTRILILNSPSNPTGMVYSKKELEAIAEICVKHKIFVISDEIYEKLIYDIPEYVSIGSLGKDIFDLTVTVSGVSKAYSMTGWRIGYCAAAQEIIGYVQKFQDHSTSNPTSISQAAALKAIQSSDESVRMMCSEFKKRRTLMINGLKGVPEIKSMTPQGAFYLFCDVAELGSSEDVAKRILDDVNVAIIPGEGFGAPGFVRLSFSTSGERIQEGTKRISQWAQKALSKV